MIYYLICILFLIFLKSYYAYLVSTLLSNMEKHLADKMFRVDNYSYNVWSNCTSQFLQMEDGAKHIVLGVDNVVTMSMIK